MEELYLQTIAKHTAGKKGKRGCDSLAQMFGELVVAMEQETRTEMKDILGDLFQGAISFGEHGQFVTPPPVCRLMARMTVEAQVDIAGLEPTASEIEEADSTDSPANATTAAALAPAERRTVLDPACGSGRMLLAVAEIHRDWLFLGQDIDRRCQHMCALNLAFRNLVGYVILGNTLALEQRHVYRTGFDGQGFICEIPLAACPAPVQEVAAEQPAMTASELVSGGTDGALAEPTQQLRLF
jgi:hypothetical protein